MRLRRDAAARASAKNGAREAQRRGEEDRNHQLLSGRVRTHAGRKVIEEGRLGDEATNQTQAMYSVLLS
jgi:hypothetical protein